jgi:hypothetical protein
MMITLCFYLFQTEPTGPDLTEWLAMKEEFGCELISINWNHTIENEQTAQVEQCPSPLCVWSENQGATHVFLKPGAETEFADLPAPTGDVIYYFGRNSKGFRSDLDGIAGLTFANLPGGDLWAHEAARVVLET